MTDAFSPSNAGPEQPAAAEAEKPKRTKKSAQTGSQWPEPFNLPERWERANEAIRDAAREAMADWGRRMESPEALAALDAAARAADQTVDEWTRAKALEAHVKWPAAGQRWDPVSSARLLTLIATEHLSHIGDREADFQNALARFARLGRPQNGPAQPKATRRRSVWREGEAGEWADEDLPMPELEARRVPSISGEQMKVLKKQAQDSIEPARMEKLRAAALSESVSAAEWASQAFAALQNGLGKQKEKRQETRAENLAWEARQAERLGWEEESLKKKEELARAQERLKNKAQPKAEAKLRIASIGSFGADADWIAAWRLALRAQSAACDSEARKLAHWIERLPEPARDAAMAAASKPGGLAALAKLPGCQTLEQIYPFASSKPWGRTQDGSSIRLSDAERAARIEERLGALLGASAQGSPNAPGNSEKPSSPKSPEGPPQVALGDEWWILRAQSGSRIEMEDLAPAEQDALRAAAAGLDFAGQIGRDARWSEATGILCSWLESPREANSRNFSHSYERSAAPLPDSLTADRDAMPLAAAWVASALNWAKGKPAEPEDERNPGPKDASAFALRWMAAWKAFAPKRSANELALAAAGLAGGPSEWIGNARIAQAMRAQSDSLQTPSGETVILSDGMLCASFAPQTQEAPRRWKVWSDEPQWLIAPAVAAKKPAPKRRKKGMLSAPNGLMTRREDLSEAFGETFRSGLRALDAADRPARGWLSRALGELLSKSNFKKDSTSRSDLNGAQKACESVGLLRQSGGAAAVGEALARLVEKDAPAVFAKHAGDLGWARGAMGLVSRWQSSAEELERRAREPAAWDFPMFNWLGKNPDSAKALMEAGAPGAILLGQAYERRVRFGDSDLRDPGRFAQLAQIPSPQAEQALKAQMQQKFGLSDGGWRLLRKCPANALAIRFVSGSRSHWADETARRDETGEENPIVLNSMVAGAISTLLNLCSQAQLGAEDFMALAQLGTACGSGGRTGDEASQRARAIGSVMILCQREPKRAGAPDFSQDPRAMEMARVLAQWAKEQNAAPQAATPAAGGLAEARQRALNTVNDLADWMRQADGAFEQLPRRFGVTALVRRMNDWHAWLAEQRQIAKNEAFATQIMKSAKKAIEQGDAKDMDSVKERAAGGTWPMAIGSLLGDDLISAWASGNPEAENGAQSAPMAHLAGWSAVGLCTVSELHEEGRQMRHCVGTYAEACASAQTRIFSIRDPQGSLEGTLQISPDRKEGPSWTIQQLRRKHNASVTNPVALEMADRVARAYTAAAAANRLAAKGEPTDAADPARLAERLSERRAKKAADPARNPAPREPAAGR